MSRCPVEIAAYALDFPIFLSEHYVIDKLLFARTAQLGEEENNVSVHSLRRGLYVGLR